MKMYLKYAPDGIQLARLHPLIIRNRKQKVYFIYTDIVMLMQ